MFARLRRLVSRHWKKALLAGLAVEGTIILFRYAGKRFQEQQLKLAQEGMERTRKQKYYETTERTCNMTAMSVYPALKDTLVKTLDTDTIMLLLKNKAPNKVELWENMKIISFSRLTAVVYCTSMLVVTLRIQLSIIGGHTYQQSNSQPDTMLQHNYLSLCQYFFRTGATELCDIIQKNVESVMASISLKQQLGLQDVEQLFYAIQSSMRRVDKPPLKYMWLYLFDPDLVAKADDPSDHLSQLISETIDVLDSNEVHLLASSIVSQGFMQMGDRIADYMTTQTHSTVVHRDDNGVTIDTPSSSSGSDVGNGDSGSDNNGTSTSSSSSWVNVVYEDEKKNPFIHPSTMSLPLAKIIPIVSGFIHDQENAASWLNLLLEMANLKTLSANVFEAFSINQHALSI